MPVTLRDGVRFRLKREPLGVNMEARLELHGPVRPGDHLTYWMRAYIDFEEVWQRKAPPLVLFRWYRRLVLEHLRAFRCRSTLKKAGAWAQP
jgi:hypothetical protein